VRKSLAATIEETGHIFAGEVEALLAEEALASSGRAERTRLTTDAYDDDDTASPKEKRVRKIGQRLLAVSVCDHSLSEQGAGLTRNFYS